MKRMVMAMALLAWTGIAQAAGEHDHNPLHGGIVVETKAMDIEIVVKADLIQVYLRDHGKPMSVDKASGKVTLLSGSEKQEVTLAPASGRLEAKGTFKSGPGTKGVVQVNVAGKNASARFALK